MLSSQLLSKLVHGIKNRITGPRKPSFSSLSIGWFRLKYLKHLPAGKLYSQNLLGHRLYFTAPQELLHGLQEIFLDEIYKQELPEKARILDCGANIGLSVLYLKKICPSARIIAFEPEEVNFELLTKNLSSFGWQDVEMQKMAVWKENTHLPFSKSQGMASHIENNAAAANTASVKTTRLRDWLEQPVDFLKLDIEGAEFEVLMDCADKLNQVKRLFIEYHGQFSQQRNLTTLLKLVTQSGFNYYIREASPIYSTPFFRPEKQEHPYQVQLNIFCFRQ